MKRAILLTVVLAALAFTQAYAQTEEPYLPSLQTKQQDQPEMQTMQTVQEPQEQAEYNPYPFYTRASFPINWLPGNTDIQRYTVGIHPFYLIYSGLRLDFEYELPREGRWIQTSLIGYYAPSRDESNYWWGGDGYGNNRCSVKSSFYNFDKMWGVGASVAYKHIFSRRGWYYSAELTVEYYRVGQIREGYVPYLEDGMKFYLADASPYMMNFVKPTAMFNLGKHIAIAPVCFLDLYVGVGFSCSIYDRDKYFLYTSDRGHEYYSEEFDGMYGFARRGLVLNGGFRFGVLLWGRQ